MGTVGAVEVLEWGKEAPITTDAPASIFSDSRPEVEGDLAEEAAEDGWWDLRTESPDPGDAGVNTVQAKPPRCPPREAPRLGLPTAAGEQWIRKKQESAADQQWEEARLHARLRQMLSSGLSSEDEDEGQLGEWRLEPYEPP